MAGYTKMYLGDRCASTVPPNRDGRTMLGHRPLVGLAQATRNDQDVETGVVMKSLVYVRGFPRDQDDRLDYVTLIHNPLHFLCACGKEMGNADMLSAPFCEKSRSIWSSKKQPDLTAVLPPGTDSPPGQGRRTLQVRMRPARVTALPSAIAPTESGKRFQNFGEETGTIPFSRHHTE